MTPEAAIDQDVLVGRLRKIFDPEIPINIFDLGLVYDLDFDVNKGTVQVKMTLTGAGCPVADIIVESVKASLGDVAGVKVVNVNLVWEPPWNPSMATEEGKAELRAMGIDVP